MRRWLKGTLPDLQRLKQQGRFGFLGRLLEDPFLFHLNRRSTAGGVAIGVFVAFLPIPLQMLLAAVIAILVRVNLILAVILVWVSNPLTMGPMIYASYRTGAWLLGAEFEQFDYDNTVQWFLGNLNQAWQPVLTGSLVLGALAGVITYIAVLLIWRYAVHRERNQRRIRIAHRRRSITAQEQGGDKR
ncbi:MAG: DUF2062 domain-containing protein [Halorhodospira halophila]|uniref:DUF2062 domain-containing protein n=1 Tax=Halorhodospira TaxID=85108 RepID=UPI001911284C|nr:MULTISPECIES: DUF2062 domain-containing protein [Halorhodospira]MBK5936853.1 hypothetical protein [Halorhodospira halophila]MBK5942298.1 hypothetical protein [Halorhodospira halophila]MCC3750361.1 DUF2062 domain-containing protein [Halorhodospira halophila]MCG5528080.1 DUF2062 domain-containing protein [Halorhodospira halophila]MCG5531849.1 DUF2062 domain-containing protein [Halorhodospira sp. 9621]